jgi:hypothetical protein
MSFTPANLYDATAINEFGSDRGWWATSTSSGTLGSTWYSLPLHKDSEAAKKTTVSKKDDEGGTARRTGVKQEGTFSGTWMQRGELVLQFIDYAQDNIIAILKELNIEALSGKILYALCPICQGDGNISIKNPGGEVPFTFDLTKAPASISLNLATAAGAGVTGSATALSGTIVCEPNKFFGILGVTKV